MTKRNRDLRVAPPRPSQERNLGPRDLMYPWDSIEELRLERDEAKEAAKNSREQLLKVRKEQFVDFFADQGINNSSDYHKGAATWEADGAKILALPEGWKWEHEIERGTPIFGIGGPYGWNFRGSISLLRLLTPEGYMLREVSSYQKKVEKQEPFRRREMLMASQRALKALLPMPRAEQDAPVGTFDGGDQ